MKPQMKNLMKPTLAILVLGIALTAGAFQQDKPKGTSFGPEQTQEQLAKEQAFQGRVDPVGTVEDKTEPAPSTNVETSEAGGSFAAAESEKVKQSFVNANKAVTEQKQSGNVGGMLMLIVGALVLAAVGFKNYTDKAVPLPKSLQ